ncbi:hypothetical protein L9F63_005426, partial [Diploptera punctata]
CLEILVKRFKCNEPKVCGNLLQSNVGFCVKIRHYRMFVSSGSFVTSVSIAVFNYNNKANIEGFEKILVLIFTLALHSSIVSIYLKTNLSRAKLMQGEQKTLSKDRSGYYKHVTDSEFYHWEKYATMEQQRNICEPIFPPCLRNLNVTIRRVTISFTKKKIQRRKYNFSYGAILDTKNDHGTYQ